MPSNVTFTRVSWNRRDIVARFLAVVAGVIALAVLAPVPATRSIAAVAANITEWSTFNKDYSGQRYVDLDQITPANVRNLKEVCEIRLGEPGTFSSGLLMLGRTLYVDTLQNTYAIDAATCKLRWRYVMQIPHPGTYGNRGPGYLDGTIYRGTADGQVIALNAATGNLRWARQYADVVQGESFVSAPIGWRGRLYIGIATSEAGIRGHLICLDAKTGKELWRFYTVPAPGDPLAKTWGTVKPTGGGSWSSYSLDPTTGEVFLPVSNPAPDFTRELRPGTNLYTNSVVALNALTGKLNWYHQETPFDQHDWDLGTAPTLYRTRSGKAMLAVAGKSGRVLGLDRGNKTVAFNTPATTLANTAPFSGSSDSPTRVCPGLVGGAQWNGTAYSPGTGALYVGMVDWCWFFYKGPYREDIAPSALGEILGTLIGIRMIPNDPRARQAGWADADFSKRPKGWITAINGESGHVLWKYHTDGQMLAGLVPTKSGLLFAGDVRGNLFAFNAQTGSVLRRIVTKGALNGGLISYAVGGIQYVAAAVGGITQNSAGVSGALRVSVYGLGGSDTPSVVTLKRPQMFAAESVPKERMWAMICFSCHGANGQGFVYPSIARQTQLGDAHALGAFLAYVPPPMPRLYPGLLSDDDVGLIASYLKTSIFSGENSLLPTTVYVQPQSGGSPQWQAVYSVLTHPRCINCHTVTAYPRQDDDRHPHIYGVVRGPDEMGAPIARCSMCHGATNNTATGIPGRPMWRLAPLPMAWESAPGVPMTGPQLCTMLKDRARNGNRDLAKMVEHIETEHFVLWAWDPGIRPSGEARTKPPLSHKGFAHAFEAWTAAGAPCPDRSSVRALRRPKVFAGWGDFYLIISAAAATLLGLIFVVVRLAQSWARR